MVTGLPKRTHNPNLEQRRQPDRESKVPPDVRIAGELAPSTVELLRLATGSRGQEPLGGSRQQWDQRLLGHDR